MHSTCFTGEMTELHLLTESKLCELNFASGKLSLNRVHRDDFPDLKHIFILFYTHITPENIILCKKKNFNILKNTLHRPHKDKLCTDVSSNKRNIN